MEKMLDEGSWLMSHAQALADYGRADEAAVEWARAAKCEEEVACLLEADGQELEAAIHRVSAASCHDQLGQFTRGVTLLRAALSAPLTDEFRERVQGQLKNYLSAAGKELRRTSAIPRRKPLSVVN
jgi:hypothetical protein